MRPNGTHKRTEHWRANPTDSGKPLAERRRSIKLNNFLNHLNSRFLRINSSLEIKANQQFSFFDALLCMKENNSIGLTIDRKIPESQITSPPYTDIQKQENYIIKKQYFPKTNVSTRTYIQYSTKLKTKKSEEEKSVAKLFLPYLKKKTPTKKGKN